MGPVLRPHAVAVVLPPVAASALLAFVAIAESAGLRPLAEPPPQNIAEAAALGEAAWAQNFLLRGQDPNARWVVAQGLLDGRAALRVTAVQAAILARQPELTELLLRRGARAGDPSRTECLVRAVDAGGGGADALMQCGIPVE